MLEQIDANKYKEVWRKAERKSIISRFQTSGWDSGKSTSSESQEFRKSDFIEALKKAAQPIEKPKPSPKPSKT